MNRTQKLAAWMGAGTASLILFNLAPDLVILSTLLGLSWGTGCYLARQAHPASFGFRKMKPREDYDARAAGWLIHELRFGNKHTRPETREALTRVLPRLKASDRRRLDSNHLNYLHYLLGTTSPIRDAEFLLALLKALEQVGDSRFLGPVRHLAARRAWSPNQRRVQSAARSCLVFLEQKAEQERIRQTLLRPTSAEALPAETLLRPVEGAADFNPSELLHVLERPVAAYAVSQAEEPVTPLQMRG
jgi:hypothetical protein